MELGSHLPNPFWYSILTKYNTKDNKSFIVDYSTYASLCVIGPEVISEMRNVKSVMEGLKLQSDLHVPTQLIKIH